MKAHVYGTVYYKILYKDSMGRSWASSLQIGWEMAKNTLEWYKHVGFSDSIIKRVDFNDA